MHNVRNLNLKNVRLNSFDVYNVENCVLDLSGAIVSNNIRFKYTKSKVTLDGRGNSEITIDSIINCQYLSLSRISIKSASSSPFTSQHLTFQGSINFNDVSFELNDGNNRGSCSIRGEGHTINLRDSIAEIISIYNVNIQSTTLRSKELILEKAMISNSILHQLVTLIPLLTEATIR